MTNYHEFKFGEDFAIVFIPPLRSASADGRYGKFLRPLGRKRVPEYALGFSIIYLNLCCGRRKATKVFI